MSSETIVFQTYSQEPTFSTLLATGCKLNEHKILRHRKIPLIRPGRIYRQRTNLIGLYLGGGGEGLYTTGAYIREEKHFNLQSVKLITFLSFFQIL